MRSPSGACGTEAPYMLSSLIGPRTSLFSDHWPVATPGGRQAHGLGDLNTDFRCNPMGRLPIPLPSFVDQGSQLSIC